MTATNVAGPLFPELDLTAITASAARRQSWSSEFASAVEVEYRRYLYLIKQGEAGRSTDDFVPPAIVSAGRRCLQVVFSQTCRIA
jgi:hypothetical protein